MKAIPITGDPAVGAFALSAGNLIHPDGMITAFELGFTMVDAIKLITDKQPGFVADQNSIGLGPECVTLRWPYCRSQCNATGWAGNCRHDNTRADPHPDMDILAETLIVPFEPQTMSRSCMARAMETATAASCFVPRDCGSPKNTKGITDELIQRAAWSLQTSVMAVK